jgi:hypothetical protein
MSDIILIILLKFVVADTRKSGSPEHQCLIDVKPNALHTLICFEILEDVLPSRIIHIADDHSDGDASRGEGFYEDFACTTDNA